ncbi:MAG: His/Gly/Thr/Pro-type tRNA ligase C-terminal domain-containing protein, partial [Chloroflexota bacterium]|nr:His/Gly/Thr/Pro-type tRNA ligase C-terminal domain-containing protein [Chloroflexota bacterium]
HTAHATEEEAQEEALRMLGVYTDFAVHEAAIPVIPGRKSNIEKFAGAVRSYTIEAMMGDGKALQSATSHNLGQNFARAFETQYLNQENELEYVWQTSWGLSTRMVGGIIMTHGDDNGLILPPRLAPIQAIIIPIWRKEEEKGPVLELVDRVERTLQEAGIRVRSDRSEQHTVGWKFNQWELKGVPLRIEIGPRDVEKNAVVLARRDRPGKEGKQFGISVDAVADEAREWLDDIQGALLQRATAFRDRNIIDVNSWDEFTEFIANNQWARVWWAGNDEQEREVKEKTGATLRCFPLDQPEGTGTCFYTGEEAKEIALFAKAY